MSSTPMHAAHPTPAESRVLSVGYNRFLDLYEEIISDDFWRRSPEYRLSNIKDLCSVYAELIKYPPFKHIFGTATRPNYELIGKEFTTFLRNILLHFPYFPAWEQIGFDKTFVTTFEATGTIDKFLSKQHPKDLKYRFWEPEQKRMSYIEIHLDTKYPDGGFVWLNDIVPEKDGCKFLCIFMKDILMTQVESVGKVQKQDR